MELGGLSGNSSGKLAPGSFTYFISGWFMSCMHYISVLTSSANYFSLNITCSILSLAAFDVVVINVVALEVGVATENNPRGGKNIISNSCTHETFT